MVEVGRRDSASHGRSSMVVSSQKWCHQCGHRAVARIPVFALFRLTFKVMPCAAFWFKVTLLRPPTWLLHGSLEHTLSTCWNSCSWRSHRSRSHSSRSPYDSFTPCDHCITFWVRFKVTLMSLEVTVAAWVLDDVTEDVDDRSKPPSCRRRPCECHGLICTRWWESMENSWRPKCPWRTDDRSWTITVDSNNATMADDFSAAIGALSVWHRNTTNAFNRWLNINRVNMHTKNSNKNDSDKFKSIAVWNHIG